ncbi:MAG: glutamate--tRNA ligase [Synergistaceae bacterium]|jgi:glutamyl-tRNA synthetase|nr:glutamate--tRNA ligase [Synergistaceae bacterium]
MIRVRFAPSPTGSLHIGGARTALFNFLFARAHAGKFILRIDDTDADRSNPDFEAGLITDLHGIGIDWDEGPYRQSERAEIYDRALRLLVEKGAAYKCFCSEERLARLRAEQLARGEPPRYDGLCRNSANIADTTGGTTPCLRFAMPSSGVIQFRDGVKGEMSFDAALIGDFVIERADGTPTYMFASVVDDHEMGITHVIRGDEHLPNTARQIAVAEGLGWEPPVYMHIPMIMSAPGQKLSKRTGSPSVRSYLNRGIMPEAIAAYLSTLSWSPSVKIEQLMCGDVGLFIDHLAEVFARSVDAISSSPPLHDEARLMYWQKEAMKHQDRHAVLLELVGAEPRFGAFDPAAMERIIGELLPEHCTLPLLADALSPLLIRPQGAAEVPWAEDLESVLRSINPWDETEIDARLRAFMKERGMKGREFFHPLRLLLTGRESGAPLPLLVCILGRDETAARVTKQQNNRGTK